MTNVYFPQCDHVVYTLVPVAGKKDMLTAFKDNLEVFPLIPEGSIPAHSVIGGKACGAVELWCHH